MTDYKQLCAELVAAWDATDDFNYFNYDDFGSAVADLVVRARSALTEPELEGPTDEEILQLSQWHEISYTLSNGDVVYPMQEGTDMRDAVLSFARAVLARWGNHPGSPDSSLQPVPVSERLPGPGDCDAEGECYWFDPEGSGAWYQDTYQGNYTHWLPTHILPLPS